MITKEQKKWGIFPATSSHLIKFCRKGMKNFFPEQNWDYSPYTKTFRLNEGFPSIFSVRNIEYVAHELLEAAFADYGDGDLDGFIEDIDFDEFIKDYAWGKQYVWTNALYCDIEDTVKNWVDVRHFYDDFD